MPNPNNNPAQAQALRVVKKSGGSGKPLGEAARRQLEAKTGLDLSAVRVYSGPAAKTSCQSLGARAFAVGDDIVLGVDAAPDSATAIHELAHVIQQRQSP